MTEGERRSPDGWLGPPRLAAPLIERARLRDRLDTDRPLTVLRAAPGFGKTTLAAQWVRERTGLSKVAAWMRAPVTDRSEIFWTAVAEVLVDAGLPVVRTGAGPAARAAVVRELRVDGPPVLLVIDDLDNLTDLSVDADLLDLLRQAPRLRLVICLEGDQRLRPARFLDLDSTVVTAADLLLTAEETADLTRAIVGEVGGGVAAAVHRECSGWLVLTRSVLVALADRRGSWDSGDIASVVEGLAAEVLQEWLSRDPEAAGLVECALSTAVAEEFTVEVATGLTGDPSTGSHLEQWASSGLLLVDRRAGESFYRWPGAARRMFQTELRRRHPGRLADLHGRLASVYADEHPASAISHAVQARNWPLVIRILDVAWRPLLIGHRRSLYDAVAAVPVSLIRTSRRAMAMRDVLLQVPTEEMLSTDVLPASGDELDALGRSDDAREVLYTALAVLVAFRNCASADVAGEMAVRLLRFARTARINHPADVAELYPGVLGQVGAALIAAHDLTDAIDPIREQYRRAPESTSDYLARDAASKLALIHALDGDLRRTAQWLDRFEAAPSSSSWLNVYPAPAAESARLLVALDRLRIDEAARFGARIVLPEFHEPARGLYLYARALLALHDGSAANLLDEMEELSSEQRTITMPTAAELALHAAAKSDLLIALGRGNLARALLDGDNHEHVALRVGQARLALLSGDDATALRLTADATWDRNASVRARQDMRLIRAIAAHRLGEPEIARQALHRAADAARTTGALRPFVTVPRDPLLELAQSVPKAAQLLSAHVIADHPPVFPQRLSLTTLTQREQLVLGKLAGGLNLQQTADALVVSYNTVRSQQASVYRKLGVDTRSDAIARARDWGLL